MASKMDSRQKSRLNDASPALREIGLGTVLANQLGAAKVAFGRVAFTTTGLTVLAPAKTLDGTTLKTIEAAIATYVSNPTAAETLSITKVVDANGKVTITRVGAAVLTGAEVSYILIGT